MNQNPHPWQNSRAGWGTPTACCFLFGAEGVHGFDAGGAPGGDEAGDRGEGGENQDGGGDRQGIVDAYTVELACHETAAQQRDRDADGEAESYLPRRGAEHENDNISAIGAEGHTQADLAGAAGYRVSRNAVEAHGGQNEREQPEQRSQARDKALLIEVSRDLVVERFEVEEGEIRIDVRERVANEGLQAGGVSGVAESDGVGEKGTALGGDGAALLNRGVQLRHGTEVHGAHGITGIVVFGVGHDADDFVVARVFPIEGSEVVADGILVGKKAFDEDLVHDRNHTGRGSVLCGEAAASQDGLADGLKETRADAVPRGAILRVWPRFGTAFHTHALAPVIAL